MEQSIVIAVKAGQGNKGYIIQGPTGAYLLALELARRDSSPNLGQGATIHVGIDRKGLVSAHGIQFDVIEVFTTEAIAKEVFDKPMAQWRANESRIQGVPCAEDFRRRAFSLLNVAWGSILQLTHNFNDAHAMGATPQAGEFWKAAQPEVQSAFVLVNQAIELFVKAELCALSPWLLIEFDKNKTVSFTKFAEFKTVESQTAKMLFRTLCLIEMPDEVWHRFDSSRRARNCLVHSVPQDDLEPDLVLELIFVAANQFGRAPWKMARLMHLEQHDASVHAFSELSEYACFRFATEVSNALSILKPAVASRWLGISKRDRLYLCPDCSLDFRTHSRSNPTCKLHGSGVANCIICGANHNVSRLACTRGGCKGNVLWEDESQEQPSYICLTCGRTQMLTQKIEALKVAMVKLTQKPGDH